MNTLNYIFFEEFKRLEKLCNEIYATHNGVTQYIDDMLAVSAYYYRRIPNWNSDLTELKRLRHIRNKIAHEQISESLCTPADIEWLKNFHKRILTQTDPLALMRQNTNSNKMIHQKPVLETQADFYEPDADISSTTPISVIFLCIVIIVALCLIGGWIISSFLF